MSKEEILKGVQEQLKCVCKKHGIEFMFVAGIPVGDRIFNTIHIDADDNLAMFLGEAAAKLQKDEPDFWQVIEDEYKSQKI